METNEIRSYGWTTVFGAKGEFWEHPDHPEHVYSRGGAIQQIEHDSLVKVVRIPANFEERMWAAIAASHAGIVDEQTQLYRWADDGGAMEGTC